MLNRGVRFWLSVGLDADRSSSGAPRCVHRCPPASFPVVCLNARYWYEEALLIPEDCANRPASACQLTSMEIRRLSPGHPLLALIRGCVCFSISRGWAQAQRSHQVMLFREAFWLAELDGTTLIVGEMVQNGEEQVRRMFSNGLVIHRATELTPSERDGTTTLVRPWRFRRSFLWAPGYQNDSEVRGWISLSTVTAAG